MLCSEAPSLKSTEQFGHATRAFRFTNKRMVSAGATTHTQKLHISFRPRICSALFTRAGLAEPQPDQTEIHTTNTRDHESQLGLHPYPCFTNLSHIIATPGEGCTLLWQNKRAAPTPQYGFRGRNFLAHLCVGKPGHSFSDIAISFSTHLEVACPPATPTEPRRESRCLVAQTTRAVVPIPRRAWI